jgi:long-subunit fatty acid transport protein
LLSYFNPSMAYQVSDTLSFGGSFSANYAALNVFFPFREPGVMMPFAELQKSACDIDPSSPSCGDLISPYQTLGAMTIRMQSLFVPGYNLGLLWEPKPWLTFGAVYQSRINMDLKGDLNIELAPNLDSIIKGIGGLSSVALLGQVEKNTGSISLDWPETYAFGTSIRVTPRFKVDMDYKYGHWGLWNKMTIKVDQLVNAPLSVNFPLGMRDTWNWAVGCEYQYNDRLALRIGVEDRPVDTTPTPIVPLSSAKFYGTGFGYVMHNKAVLDVALGYMSMKQFIKANSTTLGNSENPLDFIYNPYPGTDITTHLSMVMFEMSYQKPF